MNNLTIGVNNPGYEVAGRDGGAGAAEIEEKYDLTPAYAGKMMTQLTKARVLQCDRGSIRGYTLARPANKITLLEIVEAVNGQLGNGSIYGLSGPLGTAVQAAVGTANNAVRKVLRSTTLAALTRK